MTETHGKNKQRGRNIAKESRRPQSRGSLPSFRLSCCPFYSKEGNIGTNLGGKCEYERRALGWELKEEGMIETHGSQNSFLKALLYKLSS